MPSTIQHAALITLIVLGAQASLRCLAENKHSKLPFWAVGDALSAATRKFSAYVLLSVVATILNCCRTILDQAPTFAMIH